MDEIARGARAAPERLALILEDRRISYGAFDADVEATRAFLASQGLGREPGRPVGVLSWRLYESWRLVKAARRLGLTTVPIRAPADLAGLGVADAAATLVPAGEAGAYDWRGATAPRLAVPDALAPASEPRAAGPLGGHVLYTSGTT